MHVPECWRVHWQLHGTPRARDLPRIDSQEADLLADAAAIPYCPYNILFMHDDAVMREWPLEA